VTATREKFFVKIAISTFFFQEGDLLKFHRGEENLQFAPLYCLFSCFSTKVFNHTWIILYTREGIYRCNTRVSLCTLTTMIKPINDTIEEFTFAELLCSVSEISIQHWRKHQKILGFDVRIQDKFRSLSSTTESGLAPENI